MEDIRDLKAKVLDLKKSSDALLLAHFYQPAEVQEVADFVCDSFEMAKRARAAEQSVIVVCGVRFMAESAKILNPTKKILLPVPDAGCPMADMVTPEDVLALRKKHPDAAVVCYVNSSAAVKAVSDVCCTSSSALRIVRALPQKKIIFVPDKNLGSYAAKQTPEKELILFDGFCPVHNRVIASDVLRAKREHPGAVFAVHPECRAEVVQLADFVGSTAEIISFARRTAAPEVLVGTEDGIAERLAAEIPEKKFFTVAPDFVCSDMKKTSLSDVLRALEEERTEITLPEEDIAAARASLDRMVSM